MNSSASCINLTFTSQLHSGVDPSPHPKCDHQIVFGKFNLKTCYPTSYERLAWKCKHANTDLISRAIEYFDWKKTLSNLNVNKQASDFKDTFMNIFKNFIAHETIICDDKDDTWMNKTIKAPFMEKKAFNSCGKKLNVSLISLWSHNPNYKIQSNST